MSTGYRTASSRGATQDRGSCTMGLYEYGTGYRTPRRWRGATQGRGSYAMELHEYRDVPKNIADEVLKGGT